MLFAYLRQLLKQGWPQLIIKCLLLLKVSEIQPKLKDSTRVRNVWIFHPSDLNSFLLDLNYILLAQSAWPGRFQKSAVLCYYNECLIDHLTVKAVKMFSVYSAACELLAGNDCDKRV